MEQTHLSEGRIISSEERKRKEYAKKYPEDECLRKIREERYLWDMRAWKNHKDREEIERGLDQIERGGNKAGCHKNCGHTAFCINLLVRERNTLREKIIEAIMDNDKIWYEGVSQEDKWDWALDYDQ